MNPTRLTQSLALLGGIGAIGAGTGALLGLALPWAPIALAGGALALAAGFLAGRRRSDEPADRGERWTAAPTEAVAAPAPDEVLLLRSEIERRKAMEQDLIAAKQAAEAAMMSKGEFLATMSHEIRTPLNGIIPLLDILLTSPLGPDQRDYVQTAFGSAKQLLRIVDDILDYSKLEASKLDLETVGLNLREVMEGVQRLMDKPAETKGLKLNLSIDPNVRLAVRGDPVRLRQILTNLVSNAIKFTDRGSVSLSVTRRGETRSHHELRFEVKDTGMGIAPEAAAKLFKPFSQADTSTTRTFGGTGLGLVICKRIVDLMHGQIGVESELNRGSTFWFQIPLLKALGDMGSSRHQGLQGARVLVLSSDPVLLRRLSVSVPQWGATPVPASSVQEASSKLRNTGSKPDDWGFQLALVDLNSIRTTALSFHRSLVKEPEFADLRVVYLQGEAVPPAELRSEGRFLLLPRGANDAELRQQLTRHVEMELLPASPSGSTPEVVLTKPSAVEPAQGGLQGHVLLVEDNPVNRQVATRLLTLAGLSLDSAEHGQEAIDMVARREYDAVLMDCQMPILDGYNATREIRQREKAQNKRFRLPIIAMTANAMVGDREKCLEAGMDDYLSKPLNRKLMEQTLRNWLERSRAEKSGQSAAVTALPTRPAAAATTATVPTPARAVPAAAPPAAAPAVRPVAAKPAPAAVAAAPRAPTAASNPVAPPAPAAVPARRAAAERPAINREIVDDLKDIMGAEFDSLVQVFLEDAPRSIERLQGAAGQANLDGLVGPAHSLKSTSANLGAMELSALAKRIEIGARQKVIENPAVLVNELQQEFERVAAALRAL